MDLKAFGQAAKAILATVAPVIGTALGGPFGGLAGTLLSKALGTNDPKQIEAAITSTDPDILLKLKQADSDFKEQMAALGISEEKLSYDDMASARAREVAVRDSTPRQLAWMIIGGFIVVSCAQLIAIMGWPDVITRIPGQGWLLIGNVSGYLANEAKQCAGYYFGSSAGSAQKTDALTEIAKQA
jgi:hypothetical protein